MIKLNNSTDKIPYIQEKHQPANDLSDEINKQNCGHCVNRRNCYYHFDCGAEDIDLAVQMNQLSAVEIPCTQAKVKMIDYKQRPRISLIYFTSVFLFWMF